MPRKRRYQINTFRSVSIARPTPRGQRTIHTHSTRIAVPAHAIAHRRCSIRALFLPAISIPTIALAHPALRIRVPRRGLRSGFGRLREWHVIPYPAPRARDAACAAFGGTVRVARSPVCFRESGRELTERGEGGARARVGVDVAVGCGRGSGGFLV